MSGHRRLGRPVRWAILAVVGLAVVVLLFTVVFPWLERNLSNPTLGAVPAPTADRAPALA